MVGSLDLHAVRALPGEVLIGAYLVPGHCSPQCPSAHAKFACYATPSVAHQGPRPAYADLPARLPHQASCQEAIWLYETQACYCIPSPDRQNLESSLAIAPAKSGVVCQATVRMQLIWQMSAARRRSGGEASGRHCWRARASWPLSGVRLPLGLLQCGL